MNIQELLTDLRSIAILGSAFLSATCLNAQFVISDANSANGNYATFEAAITSLSAESQGGFQPTLTLSADISTPIEIPGHDWDSLFIRPSGQRHISLSLNNGAAVTFNGALHVVIDGVDADPDASDRLIINNAATDYRANAIRFVNGASGNWVRNCTVRGGTSQSSIGSDGPGAVIAFWTASPTTGNNNNTIANCRIRNAGTAAAPATFTDTDRLPARAIYSYPGSAAANTLARNNTGNRVLDNWIFNYFSAAHATGSYGMHLREGNHQWTIERNRFFQEVPRVFTAAVPHRMINLDQGTGTALSGGHVIRENILGFAAGDGTGTYQLSGSSSIVRVIYFDVLNTAPRSTISGNVINGIQHGSGASGANMIQFILINQGQVDADNNDIGNIDGVSATIALTSGSPTTGASGILNLGGQDLNTRGNKIGGITMTAGTLVGIRNNGSGTWECAENTVGGTFGMRITSAQSSPILAGFAAGGSVTATIEDNDIRNLRLSGNTSNNSPNVRGIEITSSSTAEHFVRNNTIENIIAEKAVASGNFTATVYGIYSTRRLTIENNTIRNIIAEGTSSGVMTTRVRGVWIVGANAHLIARNNTIESIQVNFPNATAAGSLVSQVEGIRAQGNNMNVEVRDNVIAGLWMNGLTVADTATSSALAGIKIMGGTGTPSAVVEDNQVSDIENTGTQNFLVHASGIRVAGAGTNMVSRNVVHTIRASRGTGSAALQSTPTGIWVAGGTTNTVVNNMVRIGVDADGSPEDQGYRARGVWTSATGTINLYHNSVYVGGVSESGSTQSSHALFCEGSATRDIRNNILWNARDIANAGAGAHYAMQIPSLANLTSDHNCLLISGSNGTRHLVREGATNYTDLNAWQAAGRDPNSFSLDPNFVNADGDAVSVDLHVMVPTPIDGAGVDIPEVTLDIDGDVRVLLTPVDIGADALAGTVSIETLTDIVVASAVVLWPNPASSHIFVEVNASGAQPNALEIHDAAGRLVMSMNMAQSPDAVPISLPVQHLEAGAYVLHVTDEKGRKIGFARFVRN